MEHRALGTMAVPVVGIGCNNFGTRLDQAGTTAVVDAALDAGCGFFDTADVYGAGSSEELLGVALGARRSEAVVATKFGIPFGEQEGGASSTYVRRACISSLERLGTEWIDLYQLHAPDDSVPIAETLGALDELVNEGLVRQIGCSNVTATQLRDAAAAAPGIRFTSVQNQYSLLWREPEAELLAELDAQHVGLLPYYPLANGLLTGKYVKGGSLPKGTRLSTMPEDRAAHWLSDDLLDIVEELRGIAEGSGIPMLTLAFSWLLSHPAVSCVIAGASSSAQVLANAAAAQRLDPMVIARLDAATAPMG